MVSLSKKKKKITILAMNQSIRKRSSALSPTRSSNSPNNIKRYRRSSFSPSDKANLIDDSLFSKNITPSTPIKQSSYSS